jgi:hypothetical protein
MALYTADTNRAFLPEQIGDLVVRPVEQQSVAIQVATLVRTASHIFRIPVVNDDPNAAWTAEGAEIAPSDADLDEEEVGFRKLAALSIISRELAEDRSPAAAQVVGDGMSRDIAQKLDAAFFGNLGGQAPPGLEAQTGVTDVDAGAAYDNLDAFPEGFSAAEQLGANITSFVANPADALTPRPDPHRDRVEPDPSAARPDAGDTAADRRDPALRQPGRRCRGRLGHPS